jgi:hypothetical protein
LADKFHETVAAVDGPRASKSSVSRNHIIRALVFENMIIAG